MCVWPGSGIDNLKIAVHAKVLSEERLNGMGYYTCNLLRALASIDNRNHYDLHTSHPIVHRITAPNFIERVSPFPAFWTTLRLPFELARCDYDILFVPHEKLPPFAGGRKVITVYDLHTLGHYLRSPISIRAKLHFLMAVKRTIKRADRVIAISEATKRSVLDIVGIDPARVAVTPLGYDRAIYRPVEEGEAQRVAERYGIEGEYFINLSSLLWYRKNLPGLVRAFAKAKKVVGGRLVITGRRGEAYPEVVDAIKRLGLEGDVHLIGYVPLEHIPALLGGARAMVFPSLHEGFGLPVVEAMACGCPVITSSCSSMPEVAGDAALFVDPMDEVSIAQAMINIASDAGLRKKLIEKGLNRASGFSWEKTARLTLDVFESLG